MIRSFAKPPFAWVYVGLKSGLYVCYPYHDGCDADYDPRQRPWYRLAEEAADRQAVWSEPYIGHGAPPRRPAEVNSSSPAPGR